MLTIIKHKRKITKMDVLNNVSKFAIYLLMLIIAISLLVPLIWMLINAFKNEMEYLIYPSYYLPKSPSFDNFKNILSKLTYSVTISGVGTKIYSVWDMLFYSIVWAVANPAFNVLITTMCAYVISKYKFKGRNFLYSLGIIIMILPIIGSLPSAFAIRKSLGVYNNMFLMILTGPSTAFSGMNFLLLYAAFKGIPWDYAESAFIDGASHFRVFRSIMLPMVMPTVSVIFLLGFIGAWNDYMSFLYWMPNYANIALGMFYFQGNATSTGSTTPEILSGFILTAIPIILLYFTSQKLISSSLNVGGLKG